jgi:hypothetical protein
VLLTRFFGGWGKCLAGLGNHRSPASPPRSRNVGYGLAAGFALGTGVCWVTQYLFKAYCRTLYDTGFLQNFTPPAGIKARERNKRNYN